MRNSSSNSHQPIWLAALLIFIMAVTIRGAGLGQFITVDEPRWIQWSSWFLGGLLWADYECPSLRSGRQIETTGWGCTLTDSNPGVTTMWLGGLGLLIHQQRYTDVDLRTFLESVEITPQVLATTQLPFAVAQAGLITVFYLLLVHLLSARIALLSALIITLHPFHIALSRVIHHDALTTGFMTLSFLFMIAYWLYGWSWGWLGLAAMMAGLAILSKPVGWFIMPVAALVGWAGLWWANGHKISKQQIGRLLIEGLTWGGLVCLTCILFLPAFWTIPGEVIRSTLLDSMTRTTEGHLQYFMGQVTTEPTFLFYLVGLAFRTTPVEIIGLLMLPFIMGRNRAWLKNPLIWLIILFMGFFLLFINLAPKKQIRYLLPIFPLIAILVAISLTETWDWLAQKWHRLAHWPTAPLVCMIVLWQGWLVSQHAPYYFTYYNPWLGGTTQAAKTFTVGWGEGYNEAAAYLNQKQQVETMKVATISAGMTFRPFFKGDDSGGSTSHKALSADYLVYYISLVQRIAARPEYQPVWHYLQHFHQPEYRVTLNGVDYVKLYRNPIQHKIGPEANTLPDQLALFGYNLTPTGRLTVIWQPTKQAQALQVQLISPINPDTNPIPCEPASQITNRSTTIIIETSCQFMTKAGIYRLHAEVDDSSINPFGFGFISIDTTGQFTTLSADEAMKELVNQTLPTSAVILNQSVNEQLQWVGYEMNQANQTISLYWQITQPPDWALAKQLWLTMQHGPEITTVPWLAESPPLKIVTLGQLFTQQYPWPDNTEPEKLCIAIGPQAEEITPYYCH